MPFYSYFNPPVLDAIVRQYEDEDGNRIDGRKYTGGLRFLVSKVRGPGPIYSLVEYISGDQERVRNDLLRDAHDDEDYMWDNLDIFGFDGSS